MKIYLIRHSMTEGNLQKRYIGVTDQPLCKEGMDLLEKKIEEGNYKELLNIPKDKLLLFSSPLKRCQETLRRIFEGRDYLILDDLRECDFGLFENMNYLEMSDLPEYQQWIDSDGKLPFPGGESVEGFNSRCQKAFLLTMDICQKEGVENAVFFVHGGTIMAIMDAFADSEKTYYDFMVGNAEGYKGTFKDGKIRTFNKI